jgi:hypothetical protein
MHETHLRGLGHSDGVNDEDLPRSHGVLWAGHPHVKEEVLTRKDGRRQMAVLVRSFARLPLKRSQDA